eukprot:265313_1
MSTFSTMIFLILTLSIINVIGDATIKFPDNRLINEFSNINTTTPFLDIPTNITFGRRRLRIVDNFNGNDAKLKGVALISVKRAGGTYKSVCTGSYIKVPGWSKGKFVLTAAHCVYKKSKTNSDHGKWNFPMRSLRVEFGVTDNKPAGSSGIVTCVVGDIRIHDEWSTCKYKDRWRHDLAILKIGGTGCNPTNAFQLSSFKTSTGYDNFRRAGYSGTRVLTVHIHERIKPSELHHHVTKQDIRDKLLKGQVMLSHGHGGPGDSGGPFFFSKNGKQYAVYNGRYMKNKFYRAVKLYPFQKTAITNFAKRLDGISPLFKDCVHTDYSSDDCWSAC